MRVEVDGVTVAESTSPRLLFETGLPARFYLPKPHVRIYVDGVLQERPRTEFS